MSEHAVQLKVSAIKTLVFFMPGTVFSGTLIRIPITTLGGRTALYLLFGLLPIPFFARDLRLRCLTYCVTLGGAGGMMFLLVNRAKPLLGNSATAHYSKHTLVTAVCVYLVLLITGFVMLSFPALADRANLCPASGAGVLRVR
jgi:hypothetical protein